LTIRYVVSEVRLEEFEAERVAKSGRALEQIRQGRKIEVIGLHPTV
jgi:hypothetical protein